MDARAVGRSFTAGATMAAAVEAAERASLSTGGAHLVRLGSSGIVGLQGDVLARVLRPEVSHEDASRLVTVSRWMNARGVPAVEALDVDQPVEASGLLVTFWQSLGDFERYGSTADLAQLLVTLHSQSPPTDLALPAFDPFQRVDFRLGVVEIDDEDRRYLGGRLTALRPAAGALSYELPQGVIHGDANVGNVLVDDQGVARFIDLDGVCVGPREWDLILTAMYFDRYGWHTEEEYRQFVEIYGFDVMTWDGYEVMADLRETLMLTWMAQNVAGDEKVAAEFAKRMRSVREGTSKRDWQPF